MSEATSIDAIRIEGRHRRDMGDLSDLTASIRELGVLQPVIITPDLRLIAGERRVRAAQSAGLATIPTRIVSHLSDAVSLVKAERDENTCRKAMTPEELVDMGRELERLERPKAAARMHAGIPADPGATGAQGRTNDVVADALGTSTNTYKRAKHVVQTARGDNEPAPEVQEVAQEALDAMNSGSATITGAYNKVRTAREGRPKADRLTRPQPPKYGGNRKKHAAVIESISTSLSGLAMAAEEIEDFDSTVTAEEATRLAGDLSNSLRSLNRLKQNLTRKATP